MSALNDVNIEAVAGLAGKIQQEPEVAGTKWNASVSWKGGFRSEAQVRDFEPMSSDEPGALGGTDTGPNPVEQVLAALGNCLAVGYAANATAMGIEIRDLSIDLEGDLDLHTFLGLAPQGNAGYDNISVKVNIDSDAPRADLDALHAQVVGTSPVGHTLSRAVPVKIDLA
ncbi:MAG: OsmC family protein [Gammaproteobacteria bacterium]|nr:OsmC family protein [Gammaproteobacteria bacterium]